MEQIFADGIGRISIIGGIVRLDLVTYSPTETDASGQPRPVITQRVVMGVEGFLRSSEKVIEAVQQLTKAAPARAAAPHPAQPAQPARPAAQPVPPPPPPQPPREPDFTMPKRLFP